MKETMMSFRNAVGFMMLSTVILFTASCSKEKSAEPDPDSGAEEEVLSTYQVEDLYGNGYIDEKNDDTLNAYVLINLSRGDIVAHEDSSSTEWDIGFYQNGIFGGTDVILNNDTHGPGNVEGQLIDGKFEELEEAPQEGYIHDGENNVTVNIFSTEIHINNVFSNLLDYVADNNRHVVVPDENKTWIIHTNDDKYVKLRVISLYKGNPGKEDPNFSHEDVELGYYTIEWTVRNDGSRSFVE